MSDFRYQPARAGWEQKSKKLKLVMKLAWHDFIFELPDDWEITRYSIAEPTGRFEFTGRHGALGRLSWEHSKTFPDEKRTLNEYHRRYLSRHMPDRLETFSSLRTTRAGKFTVGFRQEDEPCQALTHLEATEATLMWVFPEFSQERLDAVWRPILESFRVNDGPWREWAAFGIHCHLPAEFELEDAASKPADAWLGFEAKNLHRIDLHRWGIPRELLRDRDMESFFKHVLRGHEARLLDSRRVTWRGMKSVAVTFEVRGRKGMDRLYASKWKGKARIWHDQDEKRIYALLQAAPRKVPLLNEDEVLPV